MIFRKIFQLDLPMLEIRSKCWVNFKVKVQKPEKAQLGTLENMYVQYDCNRPSIVVMLFFCYTVVFVSLMFHFETQWKRKQVNELWVVHGDQVSSVHKAISYLDPSLIYVLPAVHALTGCDTTSKISTKASAFRVVKEEHCKQDF